jgi:hypothetical protein
VRARLATGGLLVLFAAAMLAAASGPTPPETFTATASVKTGGASAAAPVTVAIHRYASALERSAVMKAIGEGGTPALRKLLSTYDDVGYIELAQKRTPIKYAGQRSTGSGRLLTVVTAEPILYLGERAGTAHRPKEGFEVGVAMLEVAESGGGTGELVPAAKVSQDESDALLIEDYGATVIWLKDITPAR